MNQLDFSQPLARKAGNYRSAALPHRKLFPSLLLLFALFVISIPVITGASSLKFAPKSTSSASTMAAAAEGLAYIAVSDHNYLALVDPAAGTIIDTIDLAPSGCQFPWRVAIPPNGQSVWVSCRYSGTVVILDRSNHEILNTFSQQSSPAGIAFTQDSAFALIGTSASGDAKVVDTNTFTTAATVDTDGYTASVVMHPYLPLAYAVHQRYDGAVSVIDTTSWTVAQHIDAGRTPHQAVISHDGTRLYLSSKDNSSVSVIDTTALDVVTDIAIDAMPRDLTISPDDRLLYVTRAWDDAIAIIDTAANTVQQTLDLTTNDEFSRPWGMDVTCDGSTLVTSNSGGWGEENRPIALTDTGTLSSTLLPLPDNDGDNSPDAGARGLAICPQYVSEDIFLVPAAQNKQANRAADVIYSTTLFNFTEFEDSYALSLGPHNWNTVLSSDSIGPLHHGESATVTITVTVPHDAEWFFTDSATLTATSVISPTVYETRATINTQAYAPPEMIVSPLSLTSTQMVGEVVHQTLDMANGDGVDLEFEIGTSFGPGTSFAAASTELYGYVVPGGYVRVTGLSDSTDVHLIDLSNGSVIDRNSTLNRYETWTVYPNGDTYFKIVSDKAVVAVEENGDYVGFNSFIPSLETGPVGREFIFYHNQGYASLYAFAIEDADIEFRNEQGNLTLAKSLAAGDYWKVNPDSGSYHVFASGPIALELVTENGYTTAPSTDGRGMGRRFYFANGNYLSGQTGAAAVFAYEDADIELYDLDGGSLLYSTHLNADEHWWQTSLEDRQLRLESSGAVEVWAGNTQDGMDIEHLGDDISFASGQHGREYFLHSLREGFVIFAPFENTIITVDDTNYSLNKDDYLHFPDCCAFHRIIANQPILVQTLGRDSQWDDFGTYLGGVVAHSGEPVPWLAVDPGYGEVPTNSSLPVDVTFDAGGMQPGLHQANLLITSNDPTSPFMEIPVDMQVEPTSDMGHVSGSVSDLWTGESLEAEVNLKGVHTLLANPSYDIWAVEGSYKLIVSKTGYVSQKLAVDISAGDNTTLDIELEPDLARLALDADALNGSAIEGATSEAILSISNTGPAPLDISIFEMPALETRATSARADLQNRKILYDRSHDEPTLSEYATLVDDLTAAGATIDENFIKPIDAAALDGYDILWINCCGYSNWTLGELNDLKSWLDEGGAILVHGGESPATSGPAGIYGIEYHSACSYGPSTEIYAHAITVDVSTVFVDTCSYLTFGSGSILAVGDMEGRPHVVAHEKDRGKMVIVSGADFYDWLIDDDDNQLLAHNIFTWLAEPGYEDIGWLQVEPTAVQIPGHDSRVITVEFDATALQKGVYEAFLAIEHSDPSQSSPIKIPVTFSVGESVGRIVVDKKTYPTGHTQSFAFNLSGGPDGVDYDFMLNDTDDPWDSGLLKTGAYNLVETVPSGWIQLTASCDDGSNPAAIQLGQDETVTCTFSNRRLIAPTAEFNALPTSGSPPLPVQFTNLSTGDFNRCEWDFGDGGTSELCDSPTHTYDDTGIFSVGLEVMGPGGQAAMIKTDFITVYTPPTAAFSAAPTSGAPPLVVQFTNLSTGDFDECLWNFGDDHSSDGCNGPTHSYDSAGSYAVTLKVKGPGGEHTKTEWGYITVFEPPEASFSALPTAGVPPLIVNFTNLSTGDYNECLWDLGDGRTDDSCDNLSVSFRDEGLFTVSLTVKGPGGEHTMSIEDCVNVSYYHLYVPMVLKQTEP